MAYYYHLDSGGEETNLQVYSLKQAVRAWRELEEEVTECGGDVKHLKERCVFVLATLGLSIAQLLGQNNAAPSEWVPSPSELFREFVRHHALPEELLTSFERFNYFYNGSRHFGRSTTGRGYQPIDELTFPVAKECYDFGLVVWNTVIGVFRKDPESDLDEFDAEYIETDV